MRLGPGPVLPAAATTTMPLAQACFDRPVQGIDEVGGGGLGAQAQVQHADVELGLVLDHVLDALDDVFVGAGAVVAQHAHAQDIGIRGNAHVDAGGIVGDLAPDDAGHVGAVTVGIQALVVVHKQYVSYWSPPSRQMPPRVKSTCPRKCSSRSSQDLFDLVVEVDAAVDHSHGHAFARD